MGDDDRLLKGPSFGGVDERLLKGPSFGGVDDRPLKGPAFGGVDDRPLKGPSFGGVDDRPLKGPAFGGVDDRPLKGPVGGADFLLLGLGTRRDSGDSSASGFLANGSWNLGASGSCGSCLPTPVTARVMVSLSSIALDDARAARFGDGTGSVLCAGDRRHCSIILNYLNKALAHPVFCQPTGGGEN